MKQELTITHSQTIILHYTGLIHYLTELNTLSIRMIENHQITTTNSKQFLTSFCMDVACTDSQFQITSYNLFASNTHGNILLLSFKTLGSLQCLSYARQKVLMVQYNRILCTTI
jgi:hypothetical protein